MTKLSGEEHKDLQVGRANQLNKYQEETSG